MPLSLPLFTPAQMNVRVRALDFFTTWKLLAAPYEDILRYHGYRSVVKIQEHWKSTFKLFRGNLKLTKVLHVPCWYDVCLWICILISWVGTGGWVWVSEWSEVLRFRGVKLTSLTEVIKSFNEIIKINESLTLSDFIRL